MKWNTYMLLNLQPNNEIVKGTSRQWIDRYGIPEHMRFSIVPTEGYRTAQADCLSVCDRNTKLIVVAHGSTFGGMYTEHSDWRWLNGERLAQLLAMWGLRELGLLALKSCHVGNKDFLDRCARSLAARNVRVHWLLAYRNWAMFLDGYTGHAVGLTDFLLRLVTANRAKRSDKHRIRLIKGVADATPRAGSRRYIA